MMDEFDKQIYLEDIYYTTVSHKTHIFCGVLFC